MRHHVEKTLPHAPDELFQLVGDIDRYPEFVPWVTGMRTWNHIDDGGSVTGADAEAEVGFSFLKERFSTRVRRHADTRLVTVRLLSGPFRKLDNSWRFLPDGAGTRVVFDIDFAFKTRLLDGLLQANFDHAVSRLIGCFEARAAQLYGRPT